jgi:hypothetical protein
MLQQSTVADRIIKAVRHAPGCQLDDMALSLPDITWNQVFLEVDRLSQMGRVRVQSKGEGIYTLTLPNKGKEHETKTISVHTRNEAKSYRGSSGITHCRKRLGQ